MGRDVPSVFLLLVIEQSRTVPLIDAAQQFLFSLQ